MTRLEQEIRPIAPPPTVAVRLATVDSHTAGQQTRVVVEGAPPLEGLDAREARDAIRAHHDWIRSSTALEPRGGRSMFTAILLPPNDDTVVRRVVFADTAAYPDMCGHATIGVATTLVELGEIPDAPADGEARFALDTPRGVIEVRVDVEAGRATAVTFRNQPSFFLERVRIPCPGGEVEVDVAYGGQWYAFVDAGRFGLAVRPERIDELVAASGAVHGAVSERLTRLDPQTGAPPELGGVVWCEPGLDGVHGRNVPVNPAGAFDRSPCGTATCARLATLWAAGRLAPGEEFVNQGILGTVYRGRVADVTSVGGVAAVVPEVTGTAWLTGSLSVWADPTDPLGGGYLV